MNPLQHAAKIIGGQALLAKALRVTPQAVSQWARGALVPVPRVIEIARLSNWSVTPHDLRPDVYPHPDDGLPEDRRRHCAQERAA